MKVLHVGKYYSPIEGGIESINSLIVEVLKNAGNSQRVISFNTCNKSSEEDVDDVSVVRASSPCVVASQPFSWRYFKELRRAVNLYRPDIIHFHYPNPLCAFYLVLCIKKNSKLIVHWHSDVVAQRFLKLFVRPIETKILQRADRIIATSPAYIKNSLNLLRFKHKVSIIPCSIDEDKFKLIEADAAKIEEIKARYENRPIVFFIGRHVEYKGLKCLLEAEKFVRHDCVFLIAGKGPLTMELKTCFQSGRIHWLGRISDNEMRQYLYAASIFAFPSISRNEAFGVALAEAMYCGCPAVTFTISGSGVNWVSVNGLTGLEVKNGDSGAFAHAIDRIIDNPDDCRLYGVNARKRVEENFTKARVTPLYLNLYNSLKE